MSAPLDYQHPHDAASIPDDFDSDDDLDLEELDPDTVSGHQSPPFSDTNSRSQGGYGPAIALRKLRVGVENRLRRKVSGRGSEEDMNGLLENQEGDRVRRSQASSHNPNDDDAPLLYEGRRSSARSLRNETPTLKSKLRLWLARFGGMSSRVSRNEPETKPPREVLVAQPQRSKYPPNIVSNAKYTPWSFLPRTLYNEFSFFFNIYFLLVALSQIIPVLRIGYMSSYIAPLVFVVSISLGKEALDDIGRRRRDAEANSEQFTVLSLDQSVNRRIVTAPGSSGSDNEHVLDVTKKSRDLKVGDILKIRKNQRLPADVVILKSVSSDSTYDNSTVETSTDLIESNQHSSPSAEPEPNSTTTSSDKNSYSADTFIRTDQLDGETDWKLRLPSPLSQNLPANELRRLKVTASAPDQKVNEFVGAIELEPPSGFYDEHVDKSQSGREDTDRESQNNSAPLTIDNTAWANTVLASNTITYAVIIYTGSQTRAALSTSPSRSKVGLLEHEINSLTKILCILTFALSVILVALEKFHPTSDKPWYVAIMIYLILFSTIIPMSLRVNLDMAKTVYGRFIERDNDIPETVVRTSTIPEDLGRIEYLLSDKTGTLTQNGGCVFFIVRFWLTSVRNGIEKDSCGNRLVRQRCHG